MSRTYVDANVFITAFEANTSVAAPARALFLAARSRPGQLITSDLTIAEVLAPAAMPGSASLSQKLEIYRTILIWSGLVETVPVTKELLLNTAELRASYRYKLADAIHVATAQATSCSHFCSADRDMRHLPPNLTPVLPDQSGIAALIQAWGE